MMKTKKCGVYAALAAVLLITAILVITCTDSLTPGGLTTPKGDDGEWTFTPPPGKAYIRVSIPTEAGRTIMPSAPTITYYKVDIVSKTPGGETYDESDTATTFGNFASSEVFPVVPDAYQVTVSAYTAADLLIAAGQDDVTVGSGGTSLNIALEKIVKTGVNGTFAYNISLPAYFAATPVGTATVTAQVYPNGTTTTLTGLSGTRSLESGYYWLRVQLSKDKYATIMYSQILHIYGGQTSTWGTGVAPIALTLNKNAYDVTLNANGGNFSGSGSPTTALYDDSGAGWSNGNTVTAPTSPFIPSRASGSGNSYAFANWHTLAATAPSNIYDFTTKVYKDFDLFASWTATPLPSSENLTVTITAYSHPGDRSITFNPISASISHTDPFTGTFSIEADTSDLDSVIGWYYGSTLITNTDTLTNANVLTAIPSFPFNNPGTYPFTFAGVKGSVQYNGNFDIIIQAP